MKQVQQPMLRARHLRILASVGLAACTGLTTPSTPTIPTLEPDPADCDEPLTWFQDADLDGFGNASTSRESCVQSPGWVADATDCDDDDEGTYPGAIEACDLTDRDCNGIVDDNALDAPRWHPDEDDDGFGNDSSVTRSCSRPAGHQPATRGTDCDDADPSVHPGAADAPCDGVDQDCSGEGEHAVAQIGGWTYPEAQLAFDASSADAPLYLCEGEHHVQAHIEHDLVVHGVGNLAQIRLLPLDDDRILTVTADRLELSNLSFIGSVGRGDGGAVLATVREIEASHLRFERNEALLRGGAMHVEVIESDDPLVTLRNIYADRNRSGRSGGALSFGLAQSGFVTLEDAVLIGNVSSRDGGAVWLEGEETTQVLSGARIVGRDNHATGRGGTVALQGRRNAILRGRTFDLRGGSAAEGGLIALQAPIDGKIELADCVLHEGRADVAGGLIHHIGRETLDNTLSQCDLSRGTAPVGGLLWLETGQSAHLTWGDLDLHHGSAEIGSAVYLQGTASPFAGSLDRVIVRDSRGGPAFEIDETYRRDDALNLVIRDGAFLRNAGGAISAPSFFGIGLTGVQMGAGADDNGGFDVRQGMSSYRWEGPTTVSCSSGLCR